MEILSLEIDTIVQSEEMVITICDLFTTKILDKQLLSFPYRYQNWILSQMDVNCVSEDRSDISSIASEVKVLISTTSFPSPANVKSTSQQNPIVNPTTTTNSISSTNRSNSLNQKHKKKIQVENITAPLNGNDDMDVLSCPSIIAGNRDDEGVQVDLRSDLLSRKIARPPSLSLPKSSSNTALSDNVSGRANGVARQTVLSDKKSILERRMGGIGGFSSMSSFSTNLGPSYSHTEATYILQNIGRIYCTLVVNHYICIQEYVSLVLKLLRSQDRQSISSSPLQLTGEDIQASTAAFPSAQELFAKQQYSMEFLKYLVENTLNIVKGLGRYLVQEILSKLWQNKYAQLAQELTEYLDINEPEEVKIDTTFLGNISLDVFLKSSRGNEDNRNEQKTKEDMYLYNERERCFDELSNCYHRFFLLTRNNSVDGQSKVSNFLNYELRNTLFGKILNINRLNVPWFAKVFIEKMVHHCVEEAINKQEPNFQGNSAGFSTGASPSLGIGSFPIAAGISDDSWKNLKSLEFFSHFIYQANNFLLNRLLAINALSLFSALCQSRLSNDQSIIGESGSGMDHKKMIFTADGFALRIFQLRLVGRLLGILNFQSISGIEPSLLKEKSNESVLLINIPLIQSISASIKDGNLCALLPWLLEYLRMTKVYQLQWVLNSYSDILSYLQAIQESTWFDLNKAPLTSNRLYALMTLQQLTREFPPLSNTKAAATIINFSELLYSGNDYLHLDAENLAYSQLFLKLNFPMFDGILSQQTQSQQNRLVRALSKSSVTAGNIGQSTAQSPLLFNPTTPGSKAKPDRARLLQSPSSSSIKSPAKLLRARSGTSESSPGVDEKGKGHTPRRQYAPSVDTVAQSMQIAFWQRHQSLQAVHDFFVSNYQDAAMTHIRAFVEQAVYDLSKRMSMFPMNLSLSLEQLKEEYRLQLEKCTKEVFVDTSAKGTPFISNMLTTMSRQLPVMLGAHNLNARVIKLAVYLTKLDLEKRKRILVSHLSAYCSRKLSESSVVLVRLFEGKVKKEASIQSWIHSNTSASKGDMSYAASISSSDAPVGDTAIFTSTGTSKSQIVTNIKTKLESLSRHGILNHSNQCPCFFLGSQLGSQTVLCAFGHLSKEDCRSADKLSTNVMNLYLLASTTISSLLYEFTRLAAMSLTEWSLAATSSTDAPSLTGTSALSSQPFFDRPPFTFLRDLLLGWIQSLHFHIAELERSNTAGKLKAELGKFLVGSLPFCLMLDCLHLKTTLRIHTPGNMIAAALLSTNMFVSDYLTQLSDLHLLSHDQIGRSVSALSREKVGFYYEHCKQIFQASELMKVGFVCVLSRLSGYSEAAGGDGVSNPDDYVESAKKIGELISAKYGNQLGQTFIETVRKM